MKILKDIIYKSGIIDVSGSTEISIKDVCFDSRKVSSGSLFIAIKGTKSDGHEFMDVVIANGATAIVCENFPKHQKDNVTYIKVKDSAIALAYIACNWYNNPSEKFKLIGVTGTNGKTTTVTLLHKLFRSLGYNVGLVSTVKNQINEQVIPSTHTTPDPLELNGLFAAMADEGVTHCFMEVSSHALEQHRVTGLQYAGGVFTNITHDHLDYHKTFDEYIKAKKIFFDTLPSEAFALVNVDDKNGKVMLQNSKAKKKTYSMQKMSDFRCKLIENPISGLLLNIDGQEVLCKLIGSFNAYNLLATYATAILLGEEKLKVLTALSTLNPVEGRFDYIISENKVIGVVDYAHTPDALKNVLSTINNKVITVIGCGGDRDSAKRPIMAQIACEMSTKVILTSDNPRSEEPDKIIAQMEAGVTADQKKKAISITDRKEAIKTACSLAEPGDLILLAGKGHEKYQEIKGVKLPFDDKKILHEMFELMY